MKARNLSRDELIYILDNGIKSMGLRFAEIEESGYRLRHDATSKFREITRNLPNDLNELNDKELRTLYRDLMYINDLKSSTLEGAHQASIMYKDIEDMVDSFSPNIQKRFWDLYDKLYDANENIGSAMYKYDVLREIASEIYKSKSKHKTIDDLEENLMKVTELISGERDINIHEELLKQKFKKEIILDRGDIRKEPFRWDF